MGLTEYLQTHLRFDWVAAAKWQYSASIRALFRRQRPRAREKVTRPGRAADRRNAGRDGKEVPDGL